MSVSALFEGSRAYAIMDQVEQLLSHTYGPRPDIDFDCRVGVSAFCLRAFAMIDWNRSLCQRRETFFNFDFVPSNGSSSNYANDGSHDNVRSQSSHKLMLVVRPPFESGRHTGKGFQPDREGTEESLRRRYQSDVYICHCRPERSSDIRTRLHRV
jgi:hypothetical protein